MATTSNIYMPRLSGSELDDLRIIAYRLDSRCPIFGQWLFETILSEQDRRHSLAALIPYDVDLPVYPKLVPEEIATMQSELTLLSYREMSPNVAAVVDEMVLWITAQSAKALRNPEQRPPAKLDVDSGFLRKQIKRNGIDRVAAVAARVGINLTKGKQPDE